MVAERPGPSSGRPPIFPLKASFMTDYDQFTPKADTWTTRRLLRWTADHLQKKRTDSPKLASELLLAHVLGIQRIQLYLDMDRPASAAERRAYRELVERAANHEPVQYLVGQAHFFSLPFKVDKSVLIPRPSTETLVEGAIQFIKHTPGHAIPRIADVGTGSGCIAISLAVNLPEARVLATDISPAALKLARVNAELHAVADRIDLVRGSLLEPLAGELFDLIVSNPPYISDAEWAAVEPNVKNFEPVTALRGGHDGLDLIRPLIAQAGQYLKPAGRLAIELSSSQGAAALALARQTPDLINPRIVADFEGLDRILVADRAQ